VKTVEKNALRIPIRWLISIQVCVPIVNENETNSSMLTKKQQNLVYFNYSHLPFEITSSEKEKILELVHLDLTPEDASCFTGYIFNLANKRPHEWMPGEKEENLKNLRLTIQKYADTTSAG